jgi:hypothetical protein
LNFRTRQTRQAEADLSPVRKYDTGRARGVTFGFEVFGLFIRLLGLGNLRRDWLSGFSKSGCRQQCRDQTSGGDVRMMGDIVALRLPNRRERNESLSHQRPRPVRLSVMLDGTPDYET